MTRRRLRFLREGIVRAVPIATQQADLQQGEDHGQREAHEQLAGDPGLGREAAPGDLVDDGEEEEEQRPAQRELFPAGLGELEGGAEDRLQQRPAEQQAAAQDDAEQAVHDGRLQLDEGRVLQPQREAAEDHDEKTADQWHDRPAPLEPAIEGQHDRGGDDEHRRADEDVPLAVGDEEQHQRPDLEQRCREMAFARCGFYVFAHAGSPINPRAKARASNGLRSSMPSPTPTATTGRPNFSANATSTPPLALPSSLVTASMSTGDRFLKVSTWAWAFWPTVASSTSRQECGALASSLRSTPTILASSSIRLVLLCRRPAVSISSTSQPSARA